MAMVGLRLNETGSGMSKMAATTLEMPISQLPNDIEAKFRPQMLRLYRLLCSFRPDSQVNLWPTTIYATKFSRNSRLHVLLSPTRDIHSNSESASLFRYAAV